MELDRRKEWNWRAKVDKVEFFYDSPSRLVIDLKPPKQRKAGGSLVYRI